MDKPTTSHVPRLQTVEYSVDELRAIIESYFGGIPIIVLREGDQGWNAFLNTSPEIKARYEQRLQEILSVMHEHRITLREEPSMAFH